jgi:hypothetical protein
MNHWPEFFRFFCISPLLPLYYLCSKFPPLDSGFGHMTSFTERHEVRYDNMSGLKKLSVGLLSLPYASAITLRRLLFVTSIP